MSRRAVPLSDRFWKNVNKSDMGNPENCWRWVGGYWHEYGYGQISVLGKTFGAHRVSWMIHFGEIPQGMSVLHKCDNPPCVNPSHLFLGTTVDNMHDRKEKGRYELNKAVGECAGRHKLSEGDVLGIVGDYQDGERVFVLSKKYSISRQCIEHILDGDSWMYLTHISGKRIGKQLQIKVNP